jgi:hypothetical protein
MRRLSRVLVFAAVALAQPPIKRIPADGIEVPAADRAVLAGFFNEDWSM